MAVKLGVDQTKINQYNSILITATEAQSKIQEDLEIRIDKLTDLKDEIFKYVNSQDLRIQDDPELDQVEKTLARAQNYMNRVIEILFESTRKKIDLERMKKSIYNNMIVCVEGGDANTRISFIENNLTTFTQSITIEDDMISLCKVVVDNLKKIQETSSRQLTAINYRIQMKTTGMQNMDDLNMDI